MIQGRTVDHLSPLQPCFSVTVCLFSPNLVFVTVSPPDLHGCPNNFLNHPGPGQASSNVSGTPVRFQLIILTLPPIFNAQDVVNNMMTLRLPQIALIPTIYTKNTFQRRFYFSQTGRRREEFSHNFEEFP